MTHRLYYDDPFNAEFDATVRRVEARGERQAVWLDRSSFYPTSGGQPFDTGTLGSGRVVDVVDEDGDVVHLLVGPTPSAGATVHGAIDWPRRFDHMQQHTGQHMLSAAFLRISNAPTVSFHLGAELSTIDLARDVKAVDIAAAEDESNRIVWDDRAVTVRYADADEALSMGLRKESKRTGTLRLIDIDGFDLSACGGSHVTRTGAVGLIVVAGWERFKGGVRVEFACGGRALRRHRLLRDVVASSIRRLSVLPAELPEAIERLQAEQRDQQRTMAATSVELARYRADAMTSAAETIGSQRLVIQAVDGDAASLKTIAAAIAARPGLAAVLLSTAPPATLVAMRAGDATLACDSLVRAMCARFGGRGGGKPDLAQAGGLSGAPEEMLTEARRLIREMASG